MIFTDYGYLEAEYLGGPYLTPLASGSTFTQLEGRISTTSIVRSQIEFHIEGATHQFRSQIERIIEDTLAINCQLLMQQAVVVNSQLLFTIYNITNLRILYEFDSRGTSGETWTVVAGGQAAGDFSVNNLNSDIVEQVYRSTATTVTLQCDTEVSQGIFNDTFAILNHNFTSSASVQLQGSNDSTFSSVPLSETLDNESENIYWIADSLPLASYRYWRLVVTDTTNPDGYIQIGTVIFGSSVIFTGESFVDEVVRRKKHFVDRIRTEGYSSVSNDRALKRSMSLSFRRLDYTRINYTNLITIMDEVRTSLKALWIPTPQYPSRFAVFGKLADIPDETHKAISATADYIDMDVTVDEAL